MKYIRFLVNTVLSISLEPKRPIMQGLFEQSKSYIILFANAGSLFGVGCDSLYDPQLVVYILLAVLKILITILSDNEGITIYLLK